MTEKHRGKTIIQYTAGILLLAFCAAAAMFAPGWYASWQDERMLDHVALSSRESITFLDVNSLDIEGRLRMLQEAEHISFAEESTGFADAYYYATLSEDAALQRMRDLLFRWCDAGLLPEQAKKWGETEYLSEDSMMFLTSCGIYVDEALLPVYVGRFVSEDCENMLTIVMDVETDILYYVSISGVYSMDEMAKELGYGSLEAMQWQNSTAQTEAALDDVSFSCDFASVCGAEDAEVYGSSDMLEKDVTLKFEDFNSYAYRRVISNEQGFGMAVMYGTEVWQEVLSQMIELYGYWELPETTDSWCVFAAMDGYRPVVGMEDENIYDFPENEEKLIE